MNCWDCSEARLTCDGALRCSVNDFCLTKERCDQFEQGRYKVLIFEPHTIVAVRKLAKKIKPLPKAPKKPKVTALKKTRVNKAQAPKVAKTQGRLL